MSAGGLRHERYETQQQGRQCPGNVIKSFIREECLLIKLKCWKSKTLALRDSTTRVS